MGRILTLAWMGTALAIALGTMPAHAQNFPTRPIRIIVPSTPGTSSDVVARVLAAPMSKILGQAIVVENKAGAEMTNAFDYVAKQMPADGYTLVTASSTNLAMLSLNAKDLRFDPLNDLPPVVGVVETRLVVGSSSVVPWKTFAELIAHAKANPGKLNYGASSPSIHLLIEMIVRKSGIEVVHIPYTGGAAYIQALAAGTDIHLGSISEPIALGLNEKFRVLAVTGNKRSAKIPGAPTLGELGFPNFPGLPYSVNIRAGTPAAIVQRLHAAASQSLQQADTRALFEKGNYVVSNESPDIAAKALTEQAALFADLVKQYNFSLK